MLEVRLADQWGVCSGIWICPIYRSNAAVKKGRSDTRALTHSAQGEGISVAVSRDPLVLTSAITQSLRAGRAEMMNASVFW